jgi:hypothetical protein
MCKKCLDKVKSMEIVEVSSKISKLFQKIEAKPSDYKNDLEFILLIEKLGQLVDSYRTKD